MKELNLQSNCQYKHDGVQIAIWVKVESHEGEGTEFKIILTTS
jgi:hypothetical protein